MFEELVVQIKHQYGKYLNFDNAYTKAKERVYGMNKDFYEDETIVHFIPKKGGYQIKHQYGKYLNFDNACTNAKEPVFGMSQDFYDDETIVHIIPKDGGYQIKHQYGKYLNFDNAYTKTKQPVFGMSRGYYEDETIVHFIPVKYNFSIKIENFQYDTAALHGAQSSGHPCCLIRKTFLNNSNVEQRFEVKESLTFKNSTTFEHSTRDVKRWLNKVSVGVKLTANGIINLPLIAGREGGGETSLGYEYSWGQETITQFNSSTTKSVENNIEVNDTITVSPHHKLIYKYVKNKLHGIAIPYTAVMKISCEMDGNYLSDQALQFVLDYVGSCPKGNVTIENGYGVYSTALNGKITPDVALNFLTYCDEEPL